jgi:hypothetical protein
MVGIDYGGVGCEAEEGLEDNLGTDWVEDG